MRCSRPLPDSASSGFRRPAPAPASRRRGARRSAESIRGEVQVPRALLVGSCSPDFLSALRNEPPLLRSAHLRAHTSNHQTHLTRNLHTTNHLGSPRALGHRPSGFAPPPPGNERMRERLSGSWRLVLNISLPKHIEELPRCEQC